MSTVDENIRVTVDGQEVRVPAGATAAAAIARAGRTAFRTSVTGAPRGPVCGMGICFECRATIDGRPHQRSCQTVCRPGMEIRTDEP
jgi:sarcosine oxidase subunit alpha